MSEKKASWNPMEWAGVSSAWELAETAVNRLARVFLWGPPGVGKTFLAVMSAKAPVQVSLTEDLTVQELMGHWVPDRAEWRFNLGPVSRAMKNGTVLVLNEVGRGSGPVQDFLLGVLDDRSVASIALPSGETLTPAIGFKVIGTSNSGPELLDPALRSRFEVEIQLAVPHPALLKALDRHCSGLGKALGDSFLDPERALDPRRVTSFLNLLQMGVSARQAAWMTLGERAPDFLAALNARGVKLRCDAR